MYVQFKIVPMEIKIYTHFNIRNQSKYIQDLDFVNISITHTTEVIII